MDLVTGFLVFALVTIAGILIEKLIDRIIPVNLGRLHIIAILGAIIGLYLAAQYVSSINTAVGDSIELLSPIPYDYDGAREPDPNGGTGKVTVESEVRDGQTRISYKFDYDIPPEGYAGFTLQFPEPQDLSMYSAIQFTVEFQDEDIRFRLYVRDKNGKQESPVLIGTGIYGKPTTDSQSISVPLQENFSAVELSQVTDLIFDINSEIAQGRHSFTVSDIKFH